jgi:GT2 family glycosyltransferase
VVSEPDQGVYDGFNKGIDRATGDAILFLNSDDLLAPGTLRLADTLFRNALGAQIISGGCKIFQTTKKGKEVEMHRYENGRRYQLSLKNVTIGLPIINARIFRKEVFQKIGKFDLNYAITSDREFLIRAALAQLPDAPISRLTYYYRWHAGSLTMNAGNKTMLKGIEEGLAIVETVSRNSALSHQDRKALSAWRREQESTRVMIQVLNRDWGSAIDSTVTSLRRDPRWSLTFIKCGALAIGRRLRTIIRS